MLRDESDGRNIRYFGDSVVVCSTQETYLCVSEGDGSTAREILAFEGLIKNRSDEAREKVS